MDDFELKREFKHCWALIMGAESKEMAEFATEICQDYFFSNDLGKVLKRGEFLSRCKEGKYNIGQPNFIRAVII